MAITNYQLKPDTAKVIVALLALLKLTKNINTISLKSGLAPLKKSSKAKILETILEL